MSIHHCPSGAGDESTDVIGLTGWIAGGELLVGRMVKHGSEGRPAGVFLVVHHQNGLPYTSQHNHDPTGCPPCTTTGWIAGGELSMGRMVKHGSEGRLAGVLLVDCAPPKRPALHQSAQS